MKTNTLRKGQALVAGLTLMTALSATAAYAQGGGGFGGGGGGGRQNFRPPFAFGAITAVDTAAGTITINSQFGGGAPQVIKVGADSSVVTQTDTTVADLIVGDQVQVSGMPTGITVSQITVGTPPAGLPGGPGGRGGPGGPGGPGGGGGNAAGGGAPAPQGYAMANGTVKTLPTTADPQLSIALGPDVQLSLKIAPNAKITRYKTLSLADLKVGDQIIATGQTADDGTLNAISVGVNMPMARGGFGGGGFGGRGRGNRRGGPGGPPPPGNGGPPPPGNGGPPPPDNGGPPPPAPDNGGGGMTQ